MAYEKAGEQIRRGRDRVGLTQGVLADALGVHQQTVSRWEAGESRPRTDLTDRLAQHLGLDSDELRELFGHAPSDQPQRPVRPLAQHLPLGSLASGDFEAFCRDLISLRHSGAEVHRVGNQGHKQDGIDLIARLADGVSATYQCKQVKQFGKARVAAVVEATDVEADSHFLLLSRIASPDARKEMRRHRGWSLLDVEDISALVRFELAGDDARRLVDTYFPGWRQDFLGFPDPGIWLTPAQFFSPSLRPGAVLSHRWQLVGRENVLRDVGELVASDRRVLVLVGRGGTGKSRVLLAAAKSIEGGGSGVVVRFIAPEGVVQARELELIPSGSCVLVIDDAHDRDDVDLLIGALARVRPDAKLLIATRPYGVDRIEAGLRAGGLLGSTEVGRVDLDVLTHADLTTLAAEVLAARGGSTDAASEIATATADCPLFTVMAADLVASGRANPSSLTSDETARSLLLATFRDALVGDVGAPYEQHTLRRLLELVALLQPVVPEDEQFRASAALILDRHADEIARHTRTLEDSGLFLRRGRTLRVAPDLLADFLVADACVDPRTGAPTGYADRVRTAIGGELAQHLIRNLAKLDWRVTREHDGSSRVLEDIWTALTSEFLALGVVQRAGLLRELSEVSYYQPGRAVELARLLIANSTADLGVDAALLPRQALGYDHVLDSLPQFLRGAGYHLEYLGEVADLLWQLGRDRDGPLHSRPENAVRILQDLTRIEPNKPLAFSERILDRAVRWLDEPDVGSHLHSPFDVMETILDTEGHTSQSRGWTFTMTPYAVNADAVRPLRRRVLQTALARLYNPDLRVSVRAASLLESGLRYPSGLFGADVLDATRDSWTPEFVWLLGELRQALDDRLPEPVTQQRLRAAMNWQAKYGGHEAKAGARAVLAALGDDLATRLTEALAHGWAHSANMLEDEDLDYEALEARWRERQRSVATELLTTHPMPADCVRQVEDQLTALAESGSHTAASPGPFLDILFGLSSASAEETVRCSIERPSSSLRDHLHIALAALHSADPDKAFALATACLAVTEPVPLAVWVAAAYGTILRRSSPPERELALLRELGQHESQQVRLNVARGLRFGEALPAAARIDLALSINIGGSAAIADEVVGNFGAHGDFAVADLTGAQRQYLVAELVPCADIGGYQISTFLSALSVSDARAVVDLLQLRIEYSGAEAVGSDYHPVPYRWDDASPLMFRESGEFEDVVRRVLDWAAREDDGWRRSFWSPQLFACVVRTYDETLLSILDGWISTIESRRLETVAHLLREAPTQFVWTNAAWVSRLVDEADALGTECYASVASSLHAAVVSGGRSGRPGEPFPEDVEQKEKATAIARTLPPGSPAHRFFVALVKSAESAIQWSVQRDEEDRPR